MSCPICNVRKEKRFCPAVHGRICPQCCGEQREITLECPSTCPYLQQARQHEKPRDAAEPLPEEMFPAISLTEDFLEHHQPLIAGILQTLARISIADRKLNDRELIGALANFVKSYRTLVSSGLVYEEVLPNPAQQRINDVLRQVLDEFREVETKHRGYTTLRDGDVLKALVFVLRLIHLHTSGRPLSRGFIDFLHASFPQPGPSLDAAAESGNRIILP